jgi:dTDP-4-amino-4,6-dideoxygalactose transaminase
MSFLFGCLREGCKDKNRTEIVIPSYTCYSVPSSAIKAGCTVRVCDIDVNTLSYDIDMLKSIDFRNVLAIVTSNLYGIPNDLLSINKIAKDNDVFLVDDAAQSMGAKIGDNYSGFFGDAGILSLDKGKNITSIQGGILAVHSEQLSSIISHNYATLNSTDFINDSKEIIKLLVYALFLHPSLYWIPDSLPFLDLGGTIYTEDYPILKYSNALCGIAASQLERIESINLKRIENAHLYLSYLSDIKNMQTITVDEALSPVYLRFPILSKDRSTRNITVTTLNDAGFGATSSYPTAISEIEEIKNQLQLSRDCCLNGDYVAERIITLPTHEYVNPKDILEISNILHKIDSP